MFIGRVFWFFQSPVDSFRLFTSHPVTSFFIKRKKGENVKSQNVYMLVYRLLKLSFRNLFLGDWISRWILYRSRVLFRNPVRKSAEMHQQCAEFPPLKYAGFYVYLTAGTPCSTPPIVFLRIFLSCFSYEGKRIIIGEKKDDDVQACFFGE